MAGSIRILNSGQTYVTSAGASRSRGSAQLLASEHIVPSKTVSFICLAPYMIMVQPLSQTVEALTKKGYHMGRMCIRSDLQKAACRLFLNSYADQWLYCSAMLHMPNPCLYYESLVDDKNDAHTPFMASMVTKHIKHLYLLP